jgi:hypothetical protein
MAIVTFGTRPAGAQGEMGRLVGIVKDPQGALVPGVVVVVTNEKTGQTREAVTSVEGAFALTNLAPSTYNVKATLSGFAPTELKGLQVLSGREVTLPLELKTAGVSESVTVTANSAVVEVSSASIGANVSEREVQGLPVNGRQMSQLMLQAPGSQNAGTGTWGEIRFSGRAVEQNVIKYDGVEASGIIDSAPGVANGENNTLFKLQTSLENVQEFRVESSGYTAEFGTGTGGQVSVISKSGGNQFRGSIFEYARRDSWDAANYFDSFRNNDGSVIAAVGSAPTVPKSPLDLNQFGGSIGGPIARDRAFFFASYEGYRLKAGKNIIQAVPSATAWARAVAAIKPLQSGFTAPDAHLLAGASTNPDLDVMQWQATQEVHENAFGARLDYRINNNWSTYVRVFHDQARSRDPQDVSGRFFRVTIKPTNAIWNLQGVLGGGAINEFKIGYNAAPSTEGADTQPGFENISLSLTGSATLASVAGLGSAAALASPGGLVGVNSQGNGRGAPYTPYSLTIADSLSKVVGTHILKFGADVRLIRMSTDQLGGITYTFPNVTAFLNNQPNRILYFGDLSEPSPFHNGATGDKHIEQEYYVGFAQDEWRARDNMTLNFGLRYDYYAPLHERDNRIVKLNIVTGQLDPDTTPFYKSEKMSFQPRLSATYSPTTKTVFKAGAGIFVGPGQTEDQIQPVEAERISTAVTSGPLAAYPVDPALIRLNFTNNPNGRAYAPRAYSPDYTLPEKVYQFTASAQRDLGKSMAASVAYVGARGRNLFLRSVTNQIVGVQSNGAAPASIVREFSIVTCANGTTGTGTMCPGSSITSVSQPYDEVDYKTSGGRDSYDALQLALTRRSASGVALNAQYTYGFSKGTSGGSNEARTAGNNASLASERPANRTNLADFGYENGYNQFDVRHTFNLSLLYATHGTGMLTGGWSFGGILNARSGMPLEVRITRPDVVYVDAGGTVFLNPAADRTATVNTPGGGNTRNSRRPDLVPGVNPIIKDGGRVILNPAAFATPTPGTNGNLERFSIHGPNFWQADAVISKRLGPSRGPNGELRVEIFNIFNHTNLSGIGSLLPNALPTTATTEANKVQPGQPFNATTAGSFGVAAQTVGTTVGIGTNRQVQLAFRLNF